MQLLLVEDDSSIAEPLCAGLVREGFEVRHVATGAEAIAAAPVDLVLLDLGLPDLDGRVVCRELRARSNTPIIVVTARSDEIDRVSLLELGADDYVVKPFGFRELVARIGAVLRRASPMTEVRGDAPFEVGALRIDPRAHVVTLGGNEVDLTPKEHDLLVYLARDVGCRAHTRRDHARRLGRELVGVDQDARRAHRVVAQEDRRRRDSNGAGGGLRCERRRGRQRAMTRRLVLSYLAVTVVVLLLLEVPLALFFQQRELDRLTADIERDATVLATIYEDVLEDGLTADPLPALTYHTDTGARVVIVDAAGISIVDSELAPDRDYSTRAEIATALTGRRSTGTRYSETLDTDLLYVAVPIASGGTVHGALRITFDTHEVTERVWKFWIALAGVALVILTVMAGIGLLIARSVTRPVRRLHVAAEQFSGGDLTPVAIDSGAPPELVALGTAMNDMAARLADLIERQRAFVADASHQLRTPLTALRLRLENLQSAAADQPTGDELDAAIEETTRLSTLVNDLLRLARTEQATDIGEVDLVPLVRDRVDTWAATAELGAVRLELVLPVGEGRATAMPGGIEQVLDNLIDNAIRAAPAGSVVTIELELGSTTHRVSVADLGAGLADEDKARALTRFWRSDTSIPGTGLGLAIADAIVGASGGSLSLADNEPNGLVVTFRLPAASTS